MRGRGGLTLSRNRLLTRAAPNPHCWLARTETGIRLLTRAAPKPSRDGHGAVYFSATNKYRLRLKKNSPF
jgi:hypothetical protein